MATCDDSHIYLAPEVESHVFRTADSLRLMRGISSRDAETRRQAIDVIARTLDGWLEGYGSPPRGNNGTIDSHGRLTFSVGDPKQLVKEQLPDLLRLSTDCPFEDVRERCAGILLDLQDRGVQIPKSVFPSASSFFPISTIGAISNSKETLDLLMDVFLQNNCLEHVFQVMSYHPKYLECFMRMQQYLMCGDGPLPFSYRHYIAIMAAARHHCSYLVNIHSTEFLLQHGDEQWLKGVQHAPAKLQRLSEVNRILAHRPWLITTDHIQRLVQGSEDCQDNWSVSELMHAIVLLAHFHALASFVFGCGVTSETDHPGGHVYADEYNDVGDKEDSTPVNGHTAVAAELDSEADDGEVGGNCGIDSLLQTMRHIKEMASDEITEDQMTQSFEKVENQNADLLTLLTSDDTAAVFGGSVARFVEDSEFTYEDFARRGEKSTIPTFRASDFSWDDYGFSLGNGLYTDIGTLLDDRFTVAQNLTYHTMGDKNNVDTTSFRRAIWNYIHSLFGIRHDDYDYSVINKLLERPLKAYVKIVTCFPERVLLADYDAFMRDFNHSEKVHVNVMLLEAKLQAELLYSFRAVNKFMTYR